jgi:LysR family glycine cleavage system transcriptional activator
MPMMTPIRGVRSFCIAAKCLSFKHAAAQLFITPSAVSHQIKQLEEQLGFELFQRQTRSIELTTLGQRFYQQINPIIQQLEQTIKDFSQLEQNDTISISLPEFFASELFVPKLSDWSQQYPNINLQLETFKSDQHQMRATDLSIHLASTPPMNGIVEKLFPLRYLPACNLAHYKQWKSEGYNILNQVPLILHQARPWAWHQWANKYHINDFDPQKIIQFDSMFGVARAAQKGMGIALVPLPIAQSWFDEKLLVSLFDDELLTHDYYYLVKNEQFANNQPVEEFAQWILNTFTK